MCVAQVSGYLTIHDDILDAPIPPDQVLILANCCRSHNFVLKQVPHSRRYGVF